MFLTLEINPGYQLTYPEDPKNFNLADSPVIHFLNPQGRVVKYWLSVRSNSLPVIDASKIKIEGSTTTNDVTLSSATKTLTVNYALGMDMTAITLVFEQGSLLEGGSVGENNRATFDLSTGKTCELTVRMNDKQVSYRVIINFGRVMAARRVSVFATLRISSSTRSRHSPSTRPRRCRLCRSAMRACPKSHSFWNYNNNYETQLNAMAFLGDWASNRPVVNLTNQSLTVIFANSAAISGNIQVSKASGLELDASLAIWS